MYVTSRAVVFHDPNLINLLDTVHYFRDPIQPDYEENAPIEVPGANHGNYYDPFES